MNEIEDRLSRERAATLFPAAKGDLVTRIAERVLVDESGCWLWRGRLGWKGYAQMRVGAARPVAHRVVWQVCNGPVPEGLQLDHLCRVRHCVNPDHLEPVTARENMLRGEGPGAQYLRRETCNQGHTWTPENALTRKAGGRECRECARIRSRKRWAK